MEASGLDRLTDQLGPPVLLQRGQYLYRHGDATDAVHVVRSGAFKTVFVTPAGEEHVTALHFPGELFGLAGFTTGVHADSAVALDTASVCRVRLTDLPALWNIGCDHAFLHLSGQKELSGTRIRLRMSEPSAAARIASLLLERAERQAQTGQHRDPVYLPVSRTDLANYLGMTLESLSRTLGKLVRAGAIATERQAIRILKPDDLATLCDEVR